VEIRKGPRGMRDDIMLKVGYSTPILVQESYIIGYNNRSKFEHQYM